MPGRPHPEVRSSGADSRHEHPPDSLLLYLVGDRNLVAERSALEEEDSVEPVVALGRCGHGVHVVRTSRPQDLEHLGGRDVLGLVHDDHAVLGDERAYDGVAGDLSPLEE